MNKTLTTTIIIAVVLIIAAFYGGMKYSQQSVAAARASRSSQFAGQFAAGGAGIAGGFGGRGGAGGGLTTGSILSKDATSITIQLANNPNNPAAPTGTVIVYLSASTTVSKMTVDSASDLSVGQNVVVTGAKSASGAVTANSIQIRS